MIWTSIDKIDRCKIRLIYLALLLFIMLRPATIYASEPLRIGINPWPGYEFVFLAQEKGFFKKLGLDLKLIEFSSLTDTSNAYQRKEVDGLATTAVDMYFAHKRNPRRDMQIVLVTDYSNGADQIIGRNFNSKTNSLKGLKVAVEPDSLGIYFIRRILEKQHLGTDDVKLVIADQSKMRQMMESNEIDVAVTYPPFSIDIAKLPGAKVLFTSVDIPGEIIDLFAINRAWVEKNREKVPLLAEGFYQAIEFAKSNSIEAMKIMATREGITTDELAVALNGIKLADKAEWSKTFADGKLLRSSLQNIARIFANLKHSENVPWNIDTILEPALPNRGSSHP